MKAYSIFKLILSLLLTLSLVMPSFGAVVPATAVDAASLSSASGENAVSPELIENLKAAFNLAQREYLKSESAKSEALWRDVVSFALKADWREAHREMIQIAFLRLAQFASSSQKTQYWLNEAVHFDPDHKPPTAYFSNALYDQYELTHTKLQEKFVDMNTETASGYSWLVVNGRLYNLENTWLIRLPPTTQRFTLLSTELVTVTRVMNPEQWARFQPEKERKRDELIARDANGTTAPVSKSSLATSVDYFMGAPSIASKAPEQPIYRNKWFWLGTAVAVGALIVYQRSREDKNEPAPAPTHREGF